MVFFEKEGFPPPHTLSVSFTFFPESLFPRFIPSGPLSSLVVSDTLVCLGNRVEGLLRILRRHVRGECLDVEG